MTKDEKNLELVQRAVAQLKALPPPVGLIEAASIKQYYAIFDSPARWKAGIRTPQEALAPAKKLNLSFKIRERGKPLASPHLN
ncbi:MAG TPA: hypothetical protein VGC39_05565 [Candidatus Methylacidiphilales bacterium]